MSAMIDSYSGAGLTTPGWYFAVCTRTPDSGIAENRNHRVQPVAVRGEVCGPSKRRGCAQGPARRSGSTSTAEPRDKVTHTM